jgi:hypothetical protein
MGIQHRLAGSKMGDGLVVEIRRSAELNQNRLVRGDGRLFITVCDEILDQAFKGIWWMPWH